MRTLSEGRRTVVDVVANRMARLIDEARSVFLCAPQEFLPLEIMAAAMRRAHGADGFVEVLASSPTAATVLEAQVLVLTDDEVVQLHPELAEQPDLLHHVLHNTGGVPGLCDLFGATWGGTNSARELAAGWAERLYDEVVADPVVSLHMWVARLHEDSVRIVGEAITGEPQPIDRIREIRSRNHFTVTSAHDPCIPDLVASELRRIRQRRDPECFRDERRDLLEAVAAAKGVRMLERTRLLMNFHAWDHLEELFSRGMCPLAYSTPIQRATFLLVLPKALPVNRPYLARAREYFSGQWPHHHDHHPWHDFMYLLPDDRAIPEGSMTARLVERVTKGIDHMHARTIDDLCDCVRTGFVWMGGELEAHRHGERDWDADEAAVIALANLGMADACVCVGLVGDAQECIARVLLLAERAGFEPSWYPMLQVAVLSRGALFAAAAGADAVARQFQQRYRAAVAELGEEPWTHRQFVHVSQRLLSTDEDDLSPLDPSLQAPHAPYALEAEALRVLTVQGAPGMHWVRARLDETSWSTQPTWHWWPVHALLALMDARLGRPVAAASWLARTSMPPMLERIVRAAIMLADRDRDGARIEIDRVLETDALLPRWRMVATGIKIATLVGTDRWATDGEGLLGATDWAAYPRDCVLLPDQARALVLTRLPGWYRELAGMRPGETDETPERGTLTPRQRDVLRGLAVGLTMGEIAERLVVSVETVRSTSKSLYRRLGVHDRRAAVQRAGYLGLL